MLVLPAVRLLTLGVVILMLCPSLVWAGGWYLLKPSVWRDSKPGSTWVVDKRPLSEWDIVKAYDSTNDCEAGRSKTLREAVEISTLQQRAGKDGDAILVLAAAMVCVASDDPRLK